MAGTGGPWQCGWQGWQRQSCPQVTSLNPDTGNTVDEEQPRRPGSSLQMGGRPPSLPRALLQCAPDGLEEHKCFLCLLPEPEVGYTPIPGVQEGRYKKAFESGQTAVQ